MTIANCAKCGRIFQRTHSPMCPPCVQETASLISMVYRFIQANPALTIDQVADQCGLPLRDVEAMLFQGKLGTAAAHLMSYCQRCNVPIVASRGHFCVNCAGKLENEATKQILPEDKPPPPSAMAARQFHSGQPGLKPNRLEFEDPRLHNKPAGENSYGFKRLSES